MFLEHNKKTWIFLACLAAGVAVGGCGGGGSDDDKDEPDPPSGCTSDCTDLTGNLTGSWLAESINFNYVSTSTDPEDSYTFTGTGTRREVFIIDNYDGLRIYTCGSGILTTDAVTNIENTNTTLSFDYRNYDGEDAHYMLNKIDEDSLEGNFGIDITYNEYEAQTEDGAVTFRKFRTFASLADAFRGQLNFQLNGDVLDTTYLACFMQTEAHGSDAEEGSGTGSVIAVAGVDESGNYEGIYADNSHPDSAPDTGWRGFLFHLNGVFVNTDTDVDPNLQVDVTSSFADDIFTFDISAAGSGPDASGDAFEFEFSGEGGFTLVDDASSDAP